MDPADANLNISLTPCPSADLPLWIHNSKGILTAKTAYEFIQNGRGSSSSPLNREQWRKVWKLKMQQTQIDAAEDYN